MHFCQTTRPITKFGTLTIFKLYQIYKKQYITCKKKTGADHSVPGCNDNFAGCIISGKVPCEGRHGVASAVNSITQDGDHPDQSSWSADGTKYPPCRGCTF